MAYKELIISTASVEETEGIAEKIGKGLRGGELIELISDLGGGKTAFTRGLAWGAGSQDVVASPTFTISKVYKADKFEIHHFDFYRLPDPGLIVHELEDLLGNLAVVIVVEWANIVQDSLPENHVSIEFKNTGDTSRELRIRYPESMSYLLEPIC